MTTTTSQPKAGAARDNGEYVDIEGVATYYEVSGSGSPTVLLHGGMCTAESFDPQTAALAQRYRVYVPERFAQGRTRDIDGPITYENMAEHTIRFIEAMGLESADLVGWSDGALVAMLVALRRPKLVHKVVLIDQFVTLEDVPPGYLPMMQGMTADTVPPMFREQYGALSPDGADHWPIAFGKLHELWLAPTGVEVSDLQHLTAPTLVLAGDDGALTLAHLADVARALPDHQVAVVPGTTHGVAIEKPHIVNALLLDFLADEQAPKLFAMDEFNQD